MLAVKVMQEQGIEVEGVNFYTGFCVEGHTHAIREKDKGKDKRNNALWVAERLGIKLHIIDISEEYKDVVLNPKHGYGAHMNPCLDCKIFMVGKANLMLNKARVHVRAVTVFRIQHHVLVLFGDIDDVQLDTETLGHPQGIV